MQKTSSGTESRDSETSTTLGKSKIVTNKKFIDELLVEIKKVKYSVLICAYSWRWYDLEPELQIQKFNTALLQKQRQGVNVQIIVDSLVDYKKLKELGFKVAVVDKEKTLHVKAVCFDNQTLALGSHNLTKHATMDNYETTIFSTEAELVMQFIYYFYRLWRVYG